MGVFFFFFFFLNWTDVLLSLNAKINFGSRELCSLKNAVGPDRFSDHP